MTHNGRVLTNWAGNVTFRARRVHRPSTLDDLRRLVAGSAKVRAVGTGHSFNRIADTSEDMVTLADMPPVMQLDATRRVVAVAAGVRYGELAKYLHGEGFALENLGSLPHLSVAGACATATHGSGDRNGNLATSVVAMELVTADGDVVELEEVEGAAVHLGALGVVTRLWLRVVPDFQVRQHVYLDVPSFDPEIFASAYSVSMFTDWTSTAINQVWVKERLGDPDEPWRGAHPATLPMHPIASMSPQACTDQLGMPGPWHARLPHFRLDHVPSAGDELQSEYFVPRALAAQAFQAIAGLRERIAPLLQIGEIRTIAADSLWMSPCFERDCVAFHFTWKRDDAGVAQLLEPLEEALAPMGARPHWGKLFRRAPLAHPGFAELARSYDAKGKFRNDFLNELLQ